MNYSLVDYIKFFTSVLAAGGVIFGICKAVVRWRHERAEERDLSLFFGDEKNILEYKKNYVRTQAVDRPPDDEEDYAKTQHFANKMDLIDFFMKRFKERNKLCFLILADAGMGKTTFLVNLFLEYSGKWMNKKYRIKYVALGDPYADEYIAKCKDDGSYSKDGSRTILLLDAFDEDPRALDNYSKRFNELILNCRTFAKVIITSRTQFFPEEDKEKFSEYITLNDKNITTLAVAKKYIAPFSDNDVSKYLRSRYSSKFRVLGTTFYLNDVRRIAEDICRKATNLVARPMLLENIGLIISDGKKINYESDIYETLINSWIDRESRKQLYKQPNVGVFKKEMNAFITHAAVHCYENFINGKGQFIESFMLEKIADDNSVELSKVDLSARSLLNRNSKGRFKFSHKTILEYLLARYDVNELQPDKFIDFNSFDFGLYIRNQLGFFAAIQIFRPLYLQFHSQQGFVLIHTDFLHELSGVTKVIAVNYDSFVARKLRFFPNLEALYLFNVAPSDRDSLNAIISNEVHSLTFEYGKLFISERCGKRTSLTAYAEPIANDPFFVLGGIKGFRIHAVV